MSTATGKVLKSYWAIQHPQLPLLSLVEGTEFPPWVYLWISTRSIESLKDSLFDNEYRPANQYSRSMTLVQVIDYTVVRNSFTLVYFTLSSILSTE